VLEYELGSVGLGHVPLVAFYEHRKEPSGSMKGG
jgi:hypothetical protein